MDPTMPGEAMACDNVAKTRFIEVSDMNFILSLLRRASQPNALSSASAVERISVVGQLNVRVLQTHPPFAGVIYWVGR